VCENVQPYRSRPTHQAKQILAQNADFDVESELSLVQHVRGICYICGKQILDTTMYSGHGQMMEKCVVSFLFLHATTCTYFT